MKKPTIISLIQVDGKWMQQEDIPPDRVEEIVTSVIKRAAANIGFEATIRKKEKTA